MSNLLPAWYDTVLQAMLHRGMQFGGACGIGSGTDPHGLVS